MTAIFLFISDHPHTLQNYDVCDCCRLMDGLNEFSVNKKRRCHVLY